MAETIRDYLPLHARTLLALERLITGLAVGDRLPSERELAQQLGVSREPIHRAVQVLKDSGVLEARHGSGTWVRQRIRPRTGLIGLSVPSIEWPTIARVVSGAEAAARAAGYHVVLMHDHGQPELQQAQIASFMHLEVDGLLIFPDRDNPTRTAYAELLRDLAARQVRVVLVDRGIPGIDLPCVATDVARGMGEVVGHLCALGRRRIAVLSWGDDAGVAEWNRWTGVRTALAQTPGATVVRHVELGYQGNTCMHAQQVVAEWLRATGGVPDFDAIVAFIDDMALGAFFALREAGVALPGAVALTGFDDIAPQLYQAYGLHLTTVAQPFADIGRVAVEQLMGAIRGPAGGIGGATGGSALVQLAPQLIVRGSTSSTGAMP